VNLRIPIAEEADDPAPAEPSAEPAPEAPPPPAPGRTILVVDDDPLVLLGTQAMLEDIGHTVIAAGSAQAALDILRARGDVELVITDHAMPRMTGLQLCEAIREEWPGMPVILATGYAELPSGADTGLPRLSKPFFQNELARAVAAALPD